MTISHATNTAWRAVQALSDLAACLPREWDWRPVRGPALLIGNAAASTATVIVIRDSAYFAEVEPDAPWLELAKVGRPSDAVEVLARMFAVSDLVAKTDFAALGGIA